MSIILKYSEPIWKSNRNPNTARFTDGVSSYTDTTSVTIGYDNASFSINDTINELENWIIDGLGRHIECFTEANTKRWEGFVNQVQVSLGALSYTRGPLLSVTNKSLLRYVDFTSGNSSSTSFLEDAESQALFGVREKIISTGRVSSTTASNILNTYLRENKYPESTQSLGDGGTLNIQISCLGYGHMLDYSYNNSGTSTYTASEKIVDVLEEEPNSIFSTDYSRIEENTLSVFEFEDGDRTASDVIKSIVSIGDDTTNNRMIFGIYEDRIAEYRTIPSTILYTQRLNDVGVNLKSSVSDEVKPYDVKVGQWVRFTDFLVGKDVPTSTFKEDPRVMFIESVTYTAPYGISISGGKTDTLTQQLAKLGLGGI